MGRPPTGRVIVDEQKKGRTFRLRFTAYGERYMVTLGTVAEGWSEAKAQERLDEILADVRRGLWSPAAPREVERSTEVPSFHEFATDWLGRRAAGGLAPKTVENYRWALSGHLLPWFRAHLLTEITAEEVDRYAAGKVREGKIAPAQINTTITRLAQILGDAVEYGLIERNPAAGRKRKVKASAPKGPAVEPEQLMALLDAAPKGLRPLFATLAGAGLRPGEAVALEWQDVKLGAGTLLIRESKTDAGTMREVDLPLGLRDELTGLRATVENPHPKAPVFPTRTGKRQTTSNVGRRFLTAVRAANRKLPEGIEPIPGGATAYSLRRTYASMRAALGDDPTYIAQQLGHSDPRTTYRHYQRDVKRRSRLTGPTREAFDRACAWASRDAEGPGVSAQIGKTATTSLPKLDPSPKREGRR